MAPTQTHINSDDIARLRRLWSELPNDECNGCDGCGAKCAGDIPMTRWEFEQVQLFLARRGEWAPAVDTWAGGAFAPPCRFREDIAGRCRIYPVRPLICRLFGLVEWLPCPLGRWGARVPGGVEIMCWYADLSPRPYEHWLRARPQNAHTEACIDANGGKPRHDQRKPGCRV
jgi:hypothetical protein